VFGHLGDRLGRKKTLVATLLIMALSTVSVGLVPTTAAIGAAAPLILTCLRLLQGFALGGEWAGSALLSAECAPAAKRGFYGMFSELGVGAAVLLSNVTFLGVNRIIGETSPAFMQWGWRLPFLISAPLIGIGLYVRLHLGETPVFTEEKTRNSVAKAPLAQVLRLQRREIALATGSLIACFSLPFIGSTYLAAYAHTQLGYSRNVILVIGALTGLTGITCVAFSATLCDRVGRRRMMLVTPRDQRRITGFRATSVVQSARLRQRRNGGPAAGSAVAGPRRRRMDLVVLTGVGPAAAGDRHGG
jgi:MFS family permease